METGRVCVHKPRRLPTKLPYRLARKLNTKKKMIFTASSGAIRSTVSPSGLPRTYCTQNGMSRMTMFSENQRNAVDASR